MKNTTLIFGHKNPDTDSICSSIAYSALKNKIGKHTKPMRLGDINKETEFALNHFNIDAPELLTTVHPCIGDIKTGNKTVIKDTDSIKTAMEILTRENYSSLPIVNKDNKLESMLHISQIANAYLEMSTKNIFDNHCTDYSNVLNSLNSTLINGELPCGKISGDLRSLREIKLGQNNGVVVTTDTERIDEHTDKYNISLIVICSKNKPNIDFKGVNTPIVHTEYGIFKAFKYISQSVSVRNILSNNTFLQLRTRDYIRDVQAMMRESDQSNFPIVNANGEVHSTIRIKHLSDVVSNNVILVDHNERGQSVDGIETAKVLEIVDHHKFGDFETNEPLMIRAEAVGCTSTIIYRLYKEAGIEIDKNIAGLMLSAILSDTLIFKSPTTTKRDVEVAKELEKITGVDIDKYGMDLLVAGASLEDMNAEDVITMDMKKFSMGNYKIALGQINTVDVNGLMKHKTDLEKVMQKHIDVNNYDMFMMVITDILNKGSKIIVLGNSAHLVETAFGVQLEDNTAWLKGVVSRKKQIVPVLMQVAQS
ncbi:MAG: putative manganese-dependent inorganic diphosphatase [Ichthyobacteriaceae bacterium]|nr:putative manganese-dependent inorganic diphosphatase [Ichthyobacteriaceae bacterium]